MFHGAKRRLQFKPRRHAPGVTPSSPLKTFVKWLWSTNPQVNATSTRGREPFISVLARSIRRVSNHRCGVMPRVRRNMRAKWLGERFTRPARSAIATGSFMCALTQSVTRRICHGGSIPIPPIVEARAPICLGDSGLRIDPGDAPLPLLSDLVINMDDRISLKGTAKTCQGPPRGAHLSPRRRPLNTGKRKSTKRAFFYKTTGRQKVDSRAVMMSTAGGNIREPESKVSLGALAVTLLGGLATVALGSVSLDAIAQ